MKITTVIVLACVTVGIGVGAALVASRGRAVEKSEVATEKLFPELTQDKINAVELVSIKKRDKEFTFKRTATGWESPDKGGYTVKIEKIKEVLLGLSQLKKVEAKTSKPENYSKIGVEDPANSKPSTPDAPATSSTLLTLQDGQGKTISSVIIGNTKWDSKPGVYLRKSGEAQSWLADNRIDIPESFTGWVDAQLTSIPKDRIKRAQLTLPDGAKTLVTREKKEDTTFTVHDVPQGEELMSPGAGDTVAMAISGLSFEDVGPASQFFPAPAGDESIKPGPSAEFETFDGVKVLVQTADKGGKLWAHFVASFEEKPAAVPAATPPTPEGQPATPPAAADKKPEEVQKEVMDFNAKMAKWAYQIPDYKASAFKTTIASMLKSKPPTPPASLNQGNDAAPMNPLPLPNIIRAPESAPPPSPAPEQPAAPPAQPAPTGGN